MQFTWISKLYFKIAFGNPGKFFPPTLLELYGSCPLVYTLSQGFWKHLQLLKHRCTVDLIRRQYANRYSIFHIKSPLNAEIGFHQSLTKAWCFWLSLFKTVKGSWPWISCRWHIWVHINWWNVHALPPSVFVWLPAVLTQVIVDIDIYLMTSSWGTRK